MKDSLPHQYACFKCRKSFKRKQFSGAYDRFMTSEQLSGQNKEVKKFIEERIYKCPDCGGQAYFMGIDFKAPKRLDTKAWQEAEKFIESGTIYYRGNGVDINRSAD